MSQPFIGEIRMFGGNFAPQGWAFCNGQLLAVGQNDALFSLLGTIYGGDGRTTFGLPDMRGRIPIHMGDGLGLTFRRIGARGGSENVTVTEQTMPNHQHGLAASKNSGSQSAPGKTAVLAVDVDLQPYTSENPNTTLASASLANSPGGSQPHNNMMPFQTVNYIIALVGIYPSRG